MSTRFACSRSEFKPWVSLLIFCLVDLPIIDSGVLQSPTIIVLESKSLCRSLRTYFMYLGAPVLGANIFRIVSSSCCIDPFTIMSSFDLYCFKIHSIRGENCNLCFLFIYLFLLSIWLANLSPSLCFDSLCILACKMGLDAAY